MDIHPDQHRRLQILASNPPALMRRRHLARYLRAREALNLSAIRRHASPASHQSMCSMFLKERVAAAIRLCLVPIWLPAVGWASSPL